MAVLALMGAALAAPAASAAGARVVAGGVPRLPAGARVDGNVPGGRPITVDLSLRPSDPAGLDAFLTALASPGSPEYHHYLAPGQFAARFGPSAAERDAVTAWAAAAGLSVVGSPAATLLTVRGPASAVTAAFGTPLDQVALRGGGSAFANTSAPTLPAAVAGAVGSVVGLDDLARPAPQIRLRAARAGGGVRRPALRPAVGPQACPIAASLSSPGGPLTADQIAAAYGLSGLYGQGRFGAGVTIALYELEPFTPSDISTFEQCYGLSTPVHPVLVDSGPQTANQSGEAALDIEVVSALAPGATILVYEGPNNSGNGPIDTYAAIAGQDRAQVVSTSWGDCEPALQGVAQAEYPLFQQMAAQGQTVVAASGDTGSEGCVPDGTGQLAADDPAGQPYVTGVGGTLLPQVGPPTGETVWNDCQGQTLACSSFLAGTGAGGGGISAFWAMPNWQQNAGHGTVNAYSTGAPCQATLCREVPDVSADGAPGTGYVFYVTGGGPGGGWLVAGGTSASVLVWASISAIVDQGCAGTLGFANPALYALGAAGTGFTDVTAGDNDYTDTNGHAYPATAGYDQASGWGSPQAGALLPALQPAGGCPAVTGLSVNQAGVGGGGTLTVSGSGLGNVTAVSFGRNRPAPVIADSASSVTVGVPAAPGSIIVNVRVSTPAGTSAEVGADRFTFGTPPTGFGYWFNAADGGVFAYGDAPFYGSMGGRHLNAPIIGMTAVPGNGGYWEVATDGGIFGFGAAAHYYGSMGGRPLNAPIVGIASTPDGKGYWEVASDGGIFAWGDAHFYGSMGGRPLNKPIVGIAATPDGKGYWEVASDGGIFAWGDAHYAGSMGGRPLNAPIVGIAEVPDGGGYWEVATDGGIFSFGDAQFYGSMGGTPLNRPIVAIQPTPDTEGYWEIASDGGVFSFGDAGFYGSTGNLHLVAPIVGAAAS